MVVMMVITTVPYVLWYLGLSKISKGGGMSKRVDQTPLPNMIKNSYKDTVTYVDLISLLSSVVMVRGGAWDHSFKLRSPIQFRSSQ